MEGYVERVPLEIPWADSSTREGGRIAEIWEELWEKRGCDDRVEQIDQQS